MLATVDDPRDLEHYSSIAKGGHKKTIRDLMDQAQGAAIEQLGLQERRALNDEQRAELAQMTLRNLIKAGEMVQAAVILLALQIFREKHWELLGLTSWAEYLNHALPEDTDRHWRQLLRYTPRLLVPLQDKPVQAALPDGRTLLVDAACLAQKPSIMQDLIPAVAGLDVEKPEDRARFDEIVTIGATRPREEVRTWLSDEGLRAPQPPAIRGNIQDVQVVDQDTQEVGPEWIFNFRARTLAQKNAIRRKLSGLVDFPED